MLSGFFELCAKNSIRVIILQNDEQLVKFYESLLFKEEEPSFEVLELGVPVFETLESKNETFHKFLQMRFGKLNGFILGKEFSNFNEIKEMTKNELKIKLKQLNFN